MIRTNSKSDIQSELDEWLRATEVSEDEGHQGAASAALSNQEAYVSSHRHEIRMQGHCRRSSLDGPSDGRNNNFGIDAKAFLALSAVEEQGCCVTSESDLLQRSWHDWTSNFRSVRPPCEMPQRVACQIAGPPLLRRTSAPSFPQDEDERGPTHLRRSFSLPPDGGTSKKVESMCLSRLLNAMERSQKSQGHGSGRGLDLAGETERTRSLLLGSLSRFGRKHQSARRFPEGRTRTPRLMFPDEGSNHRRATRSSPGDGRRGREEDAVRAELLRIAKTQKILEIRLRMELGGREERPF